MLLQESLSLEEQKLEDQLREHTIEIEFLKNEVN